MRILSKTEQDLCNRILKGAIDNNYLSNIIDKDLRGICISITRDTKMVELLLTVEDESKINEEDQKNLVINIKEISTLIFTTVNLIRMLEKEGYIMLLQRANQIPNISQFGGCIENQPYIFSGFADENISLLLVEYQHKEIIVTEEFEEFCKHKFIGRDERRFRRQNRNAVIAISVAFFAALTNLFFNTWTKKVGTSFKKEQFEQVDSDFKTIDRKLDSIVSIGNRAIQVYESHKINNATGKKKKLISR